MNATTGLSTRERFFSLLQEFGFTFALIVACYGYFKIDYTLDSNAIIGKFVVIVLGGFAAPTAWLLF